MRILSFNVGPRSWRKILRSLRTLMAEHPARITALFEASNPLLVSALRARFSRTHRIICHRSDVVALVKRGRSMPRVEVISHEVSWRGPHLGRAKRGRRWLLLVWDDEAILLVHRSTPGGNDAAREAERRLIKQILERPDLPDKLAIIGDHNADEDDLRKEYAGLGISPVEVNAKVDACWVRDDDPDDSECFDVDDSTGTRLGNHGSDHVALMWRLR